MPHRVFVRDHWDLRAVFSILSWSRQKQALPASSTPRTPRGRVAHREPLTSCNPCLGRCLEMATAPNHGLPSRALIETSKHYRLQHKIESFYPETAPLRRELYVKHMQCFAADATFAERCFMAANRVGKSEGVGAYEMSLHLTDKYPAWWKGRRFTRAISAWAAGKDAKTVRDILQLALLGPGRKRES